MQRLFCLFLQNCCVRHVAGFPRSHLIFERVPVQNGLSLYKMVQNGHFCPPKTEVTLQNNEHDGSLLGPWWQYFLVLKWKQKFLEIK